MNNASCETKVTTLTCGRIPREAETSFSDAIAVMSSDEQATAPRRSLTKPEIAELRWDSISQMSRQELIQFLQEAASSQLTFAGSDRELTALDLASLQMLVRLARRCCRQQGY
jgi:hypothetical protein